ncbi:hypothetical protein GUITHDRAFT_109350 [Guillardia theta CCMP2712]|uniref:PDZ domain-containing protein n=1 Tax=Guillardia theta (strain CCMP2712) TaxID=905079 RepID=L1J8Y7_GUITC|nr:hypothetical protein GUITHDRAFT_109350 [Guillardia theta CCMP2712]EKX44574.1 hypothetical protein GUITHDRAFT_109350 [Guillardia theta CCMP2712]|eukprot:XP_005831554.1 hypothetical protein GUITHDRAFT_109350 [Guillardia theta CCMP2712]
MCAATSGAKTDSRAFKETRAETAASRYQPIQGRQDDLAGRLAGVGIIFRADDDGALRVEVVAAGGPADKVGKIQKGDTLISIDRVDVRSMQPEQLAPYILGKAFYYVELEREWLVTS